MVLPWEFSTPETMGFYHEICNFTNIYHIGLPLVSIFTNIYHIGLPIKNIPYWFLFTHASPVFLFPINPIHNLIQRHVQSQSSSSLGSSREISRFVHVGWRYPMNDHVGNSLHVYIYIYTYVAPYRILPLLFSTREYGYIYIYMYGGFLKSGYPNS